MKYACSTKHGVMVCAPLATHNHFNLAINRVQLISLMAKLDHTHILTSLNGSAIQVVREATLFGDFLSSLAHLLNALFQNNFDY